MPRRRIPFQAGQFYHIYNRGINKGKIFFSHENYIYCMRLIEKNSKRYLVTFIAYCLLPNHFHFLLKPEKDNKISQFMNSVFGSYTQAVNKQLARQGPLFQGRFRAVLVDREEYLIHLARYIHLNPVMAKLTNTAQDWPFSNYLDVIGLRDGNPKDITLVPQHFETGDLYRHFVEDQQHKTPVVKEFEKFLLD
ncbi:MAG: transposase [Anaerolineaceae bacterium]|nr:MAG: transposase [Anaerolineaceae bacterium]